MELTRRDAVAALAALGVGGAVAVGTHRDRSGDAGVENEDGPNIERVLVAAAEVVYPDAVEGTETFVREFLGGRLTDSDHTAELGAVVAELEGYAEEWHGDHFAELSVETRERLLEELGADTADEDPDGTTAERVRYYVVNELLLALYASPTGGELVGIENPQGHPGGTDSYQRGPAP